MDLEKLAALELDDASVAFVEALPEDIQSIVSNDFRMESSKDGKVFGRLLGFVRAVWGKRLSSQFGGKSGLDAVDMIRPYPLDIQGTIITDFDSAGTKDGNVLARLSRFAAAVGAKGGFKGATAPYKGGKGGGKGAPKGGKSGWEADPWQADPWAARQADSWGGQKGGGKADSWGGQKGGGKARKGDKTYDVSPAAADFCSKNGIEDPYANFLCGLPEDIQRIIFESFDPTGSKDGKVWGRLFGFVRSVWTRQLGLDQHCLAMIKSLSEESQRTVMLKFDPSRSKDGNIAGRLESFCRSVEGLAPPQPVSSSWGGGGHGQQWSHTDPYSSYGHQYQAPKGGGGMKGPGGGGMKGGDDWYGGGGGGGGMKGAGKTMCRFYMEGACKNGFDCTFSHGTGTQAGKGQRYSAMGPGGLSLDGFVQKWKLNSQAAAFIADLPESIGAAVMNGFDATGTKDGNVWGRLFGFIKSVWAKKSGIDREALQALKSRPEEDQMVIMARFDPDTHGHGNVSANFEDVLNMASQEAQDNRPMGYDGEHGVDSFVQKFGLDAEQAGVLEALDDDVRTVVLAEFSPGGTKDGNVFGRLQGFIRAVEGRHKRALDNGQSFGANKRQRQW